MAKGRLGYEENIALHIECLFLRTCDRYDFLDYMKIFIYKIIRKSSSHLKPVHIHCTQNVCHIEIIIFCAILTFLVI